MTSHRRTKKYIFFGADHFWWEDDRSSTLNGIPQFGFDQSHSSPLFYSSLGITPIVFEWELFRQAYGKSGSQFSSNLHNLAKFIQVFMQSSNSSRNKKILVCLPHRFFPTIPTVVEFIFEFFQFFIIMDLASFPTDLDGVSSFGFFSSKLVFLPTNEGPSPNIPLQNQNPNFFGDPQNVPNARWANFWSREVWAIWLGNFLEISTIYQRGMWLFMVFLFLLWEPHSFFSLLHPDYQHANSFKFIPSIQSRSTL